METERHQVEVIGSEFIRRLEDGESPSIGEYESRYPDIASELRDFLEALIVVRKFRSEPFKTSDANAESAVIHTDKTGFPVVANYEFVREIGRGGMGVVYLARHQTLDRMVALKLLPSFGPDDGRAKQRFYVEARAAARLNHANIVPVYEVGQCGDSLYYAMQHIEGQGLNQVMVHLAERLNNNSAKRRPASSTGKNSSGDSLAELLAVSFAPETNTPVVLASADETIEPGKQDSVATGMDSFEFDELNQSSIFSDDDTRAPSAVDNETKPHATSSSPTAVSSSAYRLYCKRVARIGVNVATALDYAHGKKIIHRDIKPANLLLDKKGTVWITDFGLAKTEESNLTKTGDIVGTLRYMSPERFRGECDITTDVYALGMTLFEMLSFQHAFPTVDRADLIHRILNDEPEQLSEIESRVPLDLATIIHKSIAREPDRRYATAGLMADDLQRFLDSKPILARRVSSFEKLGLWIRKNKAIASLLSLLLLFLLATSLGSTIGLISYRNLAEEAETESKRAIRASQLADEQAVRASAEAQNAVDINRFFSTEVLAQGNPEDGNLDRATTLLKVIDRAAESVGNQFDDRPVVKGEILRTLGSTFLGLGEFDKASQYLNQSHQLLVDAVGPDDLRTLDTLQELAVYNVVKPHEKQEWKVDVQRKMLDRIINVRTNELGAEHPRTMDAFYDFADVCGREDEGVGVKQMAKVLALQEKVLGENHRDTWRSRIRHSEFLIMHDPKAISIARTKEILEQARKVLGDQDLLTIKARTNLGRLYKSKPDSKLGIPLLEHNFAEAEKWLGKTHPHTIEIMTRLSHLYAVSISSTDSRDRLVKFRQELVARLESAYANKGILVQARHELATAYMYSRRFDEAEAIYVPILEDRIEQYGLDSNLVVRSDRKLMTLYRAKHQFKKAIFHTNRAYQTVLRKAGGVESKESMRYLTYLIDMEVHVQDYEAVKPKLIRFIEYQKEKNGKLGYKFAGAGRLVFVYEQLGEYEAAAELLREMIASFESFEDPVEAKSWANGERVNLARVLSRMGQHQQAKEIATAVVAIKDWPSDSVYCAVGARISLAQAMIGLKEYEEAERHLLTALADVKKTKGIAMKMRLDYEAKITDWLGQLYEETGDKDGKGARFKLLKEFDAALKSFLSTYNRGKLEQALTISLPVLEKMSKLDIDQELSYFQRRLQIYSILCHQRMKNFDAMLQMSEESLATGIWPEKKPYYKHRVEAFQGIALLMLDREEEAISILEAAVEALKTPSSMSYGGDTIVQVINFYKASGDVKQQKRWEAVFRDYKRE